eukprot:2879164-Rhodomonas_salina.1
MKFVPKDRDLTPWEANNKQQTKRYTLSLPPFSSSVLLLLLCITREVCSVEDCEEHRWESNSFSDGAAQTKQECRSWC